MSNYVFILDDTTYFAVLFISGSSFYNSSFTVSFSQILPSCHKNLGHSNYLLLEYSLAAFKFYEALSGILHQHNLCLALSSTNRSFSRIKEQQFIPALGLKYISLEQL